MVPHNLDVFTNACIHSPNPNHLSSTTFLTPKMELEKPYTRLSHVSDTCISEQPKEIACFTPNMGFYVGPWGLLSSNKKEPHINQNTGWFQPWFHWWSPGQASERQHPHRGQRRSGRKLPWDCSEFRGENSTETLLWNHAFFFCGEPISRQINLCISYCNVCNASMSVHFLQPRCALLQVCWRTIRSRRRTDHA